MNRKIHIQIVLQWDGEFITHINARGIDEEDSKSIGQNPIFEFESFVFCPQNPEKPLWGEVMYDLRTQIQNHAETYSDFVWIFPIAGQEQIFHDFENK